MAPGVLYQEPGTRTAPDLFSTRTLLMSDAERGDPSQGVSLSQLPYLNGGKVTDFLTQIFSSYSQAFYFVGSSIKGE